MQPTTQTYNTENEQGIAYRDGNCTSSTKSAVAWPAIIAGALLAAAVSLVLLLLGSGVGLASVSPWSNMGVSAATFTMITAVWLIIIQCVASSFGGYLTGRLRSKWSNMHGDEVYFRDTAHGLLSWALATVITATFLGAAVSSVIGTGVTAATTITAGAAAGAGYEQAQNGVHNTSQNPADMIGDANAYLIDTLFRTDQTTSGNDKDTRIEAIRIVAKGVMDGAVSAPDKTSCPDCRSAHGGIKRRCRKAR
jgi:hypothetical protein